MVCRPLPRVKKNCFPHSPWWLPSLIACLRERQYMCVCVCLPPLLDWALVIMWFL